MAVSASFSYGQGRASGHVNADGNDSSQLVNALSRTIEILGYAGAFALICWGIHKLKA